MGDSRDEILEAELAKLGAAGGAVGGAIGSAAGAAISDTPALPGGGAISGGAGGALGGKLGAKLMKDSAEEGIVELNEPADAALRRVVHVLSEAGEIHPSETEAPGVRAVVGSGFLEMNPAVIDATVEPVDDKRTRVKLRASAKEGLIKQGTAEKAIEKVASALRGEPG